VPIRSPRIAALLLFASACAPRARVPAAPETPSHRAVEPAHVSSEMPFVATAYCRGGKTASGVHTDATIVAVDPGVLPLGTRIHVSGLTRGRDGVYRVMDTGDRVQGRRIDLFIESCAAARRFGRQHVRVAVVR
jgi:3D (Asp-Asp-Asp) domain-containing protein